MPEFFQKKETSGRAVNISVLRSYKSPSGFEKASTWWPVAILATALFACAQLLRIDVAEHSVQRQGFQNGMLRYPKSKGKVFTLLNDRTGKMLGGVVKDGTRDALLFVISLLLIKPAEQNQSLAISQYAGVAGRHELGGAYGLTRVMPIKELRHLRIEFSCAA